MAYRTNARVALHNTSVLEKDVKNQWKWDWLDRKIDGVKIEQSIKKLDEPGKAYCKLCRKEVNYARRGWKSLEQHATGALHKRIVKERGENYSLPGRSHFSGKVLLLA